jgi:flagellar motility protein MotE (MotC chaperone)
MTARIPTPRLLPLTICLLGAVLAVKSTSLLQLAIVAYEPATLFTTALAAGPETPAQAGNTQEQPGNTSAQPGNPSAKPGRQSADAKPAAGNANPADMPPALNEAPPISDSERAVLLELRDRRRELDAREAGLTARETTVAAAEQKLSQRVQELQALQQKLEALDSSHRQQEDVAWLGLVKVYETMKPRDAAAIFNDLGMPVLLELVKRMKDAKAAAVLAAMTPEKARDVTTQLAFARTRTDNALQSGDTQRGATQAAPAPPAKPPGSGT